MAFTLPVCPRCPAVGLCDSCEAALRLVYPQVAEKVDREFAAILSQLGPEARARIEARRAARQPPPDPAAELARLREAITALAEGLDFEGECARECGHPRTAAAYHSTADEVRRLLTNPPAPGVSTAGSRNP